MLGLEASDSDSLIFRTPGLPRNGLLSGATSSIRVAAARCDPLAHPFVHLGLDPAHGA